MRSPRRNPGDRNGDDFAAAAARYEVLERVGEGTLFVVYRVRDRNDNRVLALKALKGAFSRHPRFAPALAQAARRATEFAHPNLGRMIETGEEDGTLFLVSEWIPGASLETRLRRAPLNRAETAGDMRQLAEGLNYLHQNGAVHGDLRPRQVLTAADGTLKLTDANLATAYNQAGVTFSDVEHDATYYLAPERFDGAPPTAASDLYALGVILYRMLTGRVPFDGPSPLSIAMRHRNDAPLHPSQFNRNCPPDLEAIALRLLEKNPQTRYQSAAQLLSDLIGQPISALAPAPLPVPAAALPVVPTSPTVVSAPRDRPDLPTDLAAQAEPSSTLPVAAVAASRAPISVPQAVALQQAATSDLAGAATQSRVAPSATSLNATSPSADAGIWEEEAAGAKVKQQTLHHRRRERNGALLSIFWALVAVGLLGSIVYGGYYFWVKDIPRDVTVPQFVGLPQYKAQQQLEAANLKMHVSKEIYDTKHPPDTVVAGDKDAGAKVKIGHDIGVTISRGEEKTPMFDFSEITLERARQIIVQHGMRLGQVAEQYHDKIAQGYICGQYPEPGQGFSRSEPINLIVSKGPQPSAIASDPAQLPPPPVPPSIPDDTSSSQLPINGSEQSAKVPMVSRSVRVRVAIPANGPSQQVRVVVSDADGEHTIYNKSHHPGDLVDQLIHVPRPQGTTATVRVYVGGVIQREEQV